MPEVFDFEKNKEEKKPQTEEQIKADIRESLKLSPFFEKELTLEEQNKLINEMYERYYKEKEEVKPEQEKRAA